MKANVNLDADEIVNHAAHASVVEQLSYLVDELSAQKPLFSKIADSILSERPFEDQKSIKDHYREMLFREEMVNGVIIKGLISGDLTGHSVDEMLAAGAAAAAAGVVAGTVAEPECNSVQEIQTRISETRQSSVEMLRNAPVNTWNSHVVEREERRTLLEWVYRMTLEDADTLREISAMLSEIQLIFRR